MLLTAPAGQKTYSDGLDHCFQQAQSARRGVFHTDEGDFGVRSEGDVYLGEDGPLVTGIPIQEFVAGSMVFHLLVRRVVIPILA